MPQLSVNIDHVATVRQARRGEEPDPIAAAVLALLAGADGITVHLREDRRHIQDEDVRRLRVMAGVRLNLEMAATDEMIGIACALRPETVMLVPEGRDEVTTEGGLDTAGQESRLTAVVARLHEAGLMTSAFIDAEPEQVAAAGRCGFSICEIHTGPYAHAFLEHGRTSAHAAVQEELAKVRDAARQVDALGMRCNAGHALNYANVGPVAALSRETPIYELHIGHSIVSRATLVGMERAVREMREAMARG